MNLKVYGYTSMYVCHFYKGEQLIPVWFPYMKRIFQKGSSRKGKFSAVGKFIPLKVDPHLKGRKNNNSRVTSPESVPIHHNYQPSAPIETSFTPFASINSSALFTLAILWNLMRPLSGFGNCSPDITSSNNINFKPFRKSSSIFSICVPAFLR